jgi:Restriction endonuclease
VTREKHQVTALQLRNIVEQAIADSIQIHRGSRASNEGETYARPEGPPTDEEIDDFIVSNGLLDEETQEQLTDPGLLGFSARTAYASASWMRTFRKNISDWAMNQSWLGGDLPWRSLIVLPQSLDSSLWRPAKSDRPGWLSSAPAALLLAEDFLRSQRLLAEMPWRKFEEVIGELLEMEGWTVQVTQPTRDGGIDVVTIKDDPTLGIMKAGVQI